MKNKKSEGSYYTPLYIAEYMMEQCKKVLYKKDKIEILEPSCGDGVFIKAFLNVGGLNSNNKATFCSVEKDKIELNKTKKYKKELSDRGILSSFYNQDFLDFCLNRRRKFDLIIGNPPYIHKKYINPEQMKKVKEIFCEKNIKTSTIHNIWIAFVVGAINLLKNDGILCFVLPFEMLQVKYAEPITSLLYEEFEEIKIYSFNEAVFHGIDQDVVIILCIKKSNKKLITHTLLHNENLLTLNIVSNNKKQLFKKWFWYTFNKEEMDMITELKSNFKSIKDFSFSGAGIVTGNNDFFILKPSEVEKYKLQNYTLPILKKSAFIKQTINFMPSDFENLVVDDVPCQLIDLNNVDDISRIPSVQHYIREGELLLINKNYKCRIRDNWYQVPSIWNSEAFFFKRSHLYPKLILNSSSVYVTDTAYRIQMRNGYDVKSLIFCFYNSLTLIDSELVGRSYGGGVLEITPNEFKEIKIPYFKIEEKYFDKLDQMLRMNLPIEEILEFTDEVILINKFDINPEDVTKLKNIRNRIVSNRVL
ncbi:MULTISPECIES: N-6 DNA methylase [unclassified Bacillus cereus group]|uniref:Eco57I restriction-modification methylase domain-containing protein n=1 Tax=unclassified Bacillus cereus group TaxID=2750818 RepID=UPI0011EBA23E|nr:MULTISPECIES: N-6 DNA methylase [unclassified Bacillus cereus group]QEL71857.1 hypothetical protein DN399_27920 [Bacillus sp. AR4-2]QEL77135.1 hypothetical protein DN405_27920 [Bacillus sp. SH8-8]